MTPLHARLVARALAALLTAPIATLHAAPIVPTRDDEVVEVLPATAGNRAEERRLKRQLAQQPRDPVLALAVAKRYLDQAHSTGDPRYAGMAMAAIEPWIDELTMPGDVLMMRATLLQYIHEFDASAASLQRLLARPGEAPRPQGWLTLATVRRVQGRYADSDAACAQVERAGSVVYGRACAAENAALRGDVVRARAAFNGLIAGLRGDAVAQAWLTTSLAELEQRAGNVAAADAAFRASLKLDADAYATLAYADFLIEQKRPAEALALLKNQPRSDAVLLRLAIAGRAAGASNATADATELRERIALANERPEAKISHGREQAMFALFIERDATRALELARGNAVRQREPLDLLVLAQAASASGEPAARQEAKRLAAEVGLVDRRIDALL